MTTKKSEKSRRYLRNKNAPLGSIVNSFSHPLNFPKGYIPSQDPLCCGWLEWTVEAAPGWLGPNPWTRLGACWSPATAWLLQGKLWFSSRWYFNSTMKLCRKQVFCTLLTRILKTQVPSHLPKICQQQNSPVKPTKLALSMKTWTDLETV